MKQEHKNHPSTPFDKTSSTKLPRPSSGQVGTRKIVIIEDDTNMRGALVHRFTAEHLIVFSAPDGISGLALALLEKPDIILLDIRMPGIDGMEVMKKLRESNEWGRQVPIILLTSLEVDERIMKGIVADGPAYYVIKDDFSLSDVVEKVNEQLSRV